MTLKKKYSVLIGSDISVLVLADILSDYGEKVLLVNKSAHWGQIFLGTKIKNETFDYGIVRHCLEHSAWPYMTLMEFNRIMKTGGRMYIEMPAPDGDRKLEHFQNHYSVMGQNMWGSLMIRAGFEYSSNTYDLKISTKDGSAQYKEPYHWYVITKIVDRSEYKPATGKYMEELVKEMAEFNKKNSPK